MAGALAFGIATASTAAFTTVTINRIKPSPKFRTKIRCIGWVYIHSVGLVSTIIYLSYVLYLIVRRKDPEGILGPPSTGHLARREFQRRLEKDADAREDFQRQVQEENERRNALRQSRRVPDTHAQLVEYFLDTEAQELEFEIARMRPKLNDEFFSYLKLELGQLRFAVSKTQDMEDRVIELEALEKALLKGLEAYDKLHANIVKARENLTKLFTSKDVKATLLDMVEKNEINKPLLALLDENIAGARRGNQKEAADYMEKLRGAVLKYITV